VGAPRRAAEVRDRLARRELGGPPLLHCARRPATQSVRQLAPSLAHRSSAASALEHQRETFCKPHCARGGSAPWRAGWRCALLAKGHPAAAAGRAAGRLASEGMAGRTDGEEGWRGGRMTRRDGGVDGWRGGMAGQTVGEGLLGGHGLVARVARHPALPPRAEDLGLYPIVTFQYSSTTLYQVSYHIQYLFFYSDNRISPYEDRGVEERRGLARRVAPRGAEHLAPPRASAAGSSTPHPRWRSQQCCGAAMGQLHIPCARARRGARLRRGGCRRSRSAARL
jgi:hypothetical protein